MSELSNQECRDLPGSLSDRGCYFDEKGNALETSEKATQFSCLDCGRILDRPYAFNIIEKVKGKKVVRPVCAVCNIKREEREDGPGFEDGPWAEGFAERCGENEEEVPGGASVKTNETLSSLEGPEDEGSHHASR